MLSNVPRPMRKWHGQICAVLEPALCPLGLHHPWVRGPAAGMSEGLLPWMSCLALAASLSVQLCSPPSPSPTAISYSLWLTLALLWLLGFIHAFQAPSEPLILSNSLHITAQLLTSLDSFLDNPPPRPPPYCILPWDLASCSSQTPSSLAFLPLHMLFPCLEQCTVPPPPGLSRNISSSWEDG